VDEVLGDVIPVTDRSYIVRVVRAGVAGGLAAGTALIVGALNFLPALALGPIVEHLRMIASSLKNT